MSSSPVSDPPGVHESPTGLERELFPTWLDQDPAADEPNYLGYTLLLMPVALLTVLALLAISISVFG